MEQDKFPQPERDNTGYLFLNAFYKHPKPRTIVQGSPEHSRVFNYQQADMVARKAIEITSRLSNVYGDELPTIDMEDPCGLLTSLPVQMKRRQNFSRTTVSLRPILERTLPTSLSWLGSIEIGHYDESKIQIYKVSLNQPSGNGHIELLRWPGRDREEGFRTDSYPANAQAMNFISMVDNYLDKVEQRRLIIVR